MQDKLSTAQNWTPIAIAATAIIAAMAFQTSSASAAPFADNNNSINIQVNISNKTIVDIQPKQFAWGQGTDTVLPGTQAGPSEEQNGYGRIQIENLGSVNLTNVWLNATYPNQRPFGTGVASNYDSGNFIAVDSNTSTSDVNSFISRVEYGLDQPTDKDIVYLQTQGDYDYGRFRNTSQEYFWQLDDEGGTDLSGASFRIGIDPHNASQTGSTKFDAACDYGDEAGSNSDCNGYSLNRVTDGSGNVWGVTDVEVGVPDTTLTSNDGGVQYCVAIDEDVALADDGTDPQVFFIKYAKSFPAVEASGADCSTVTEYLIGSGNELAPGGFQVFNIRAKIPYGVVAEQLPAGSVYVKASSAA